MNALARAAVVLAACALVGPLVWAAAEDPTTRPKDLPDHSYGTTGILGPFVWSRAADLGEDVRFSDADGRPKMDGDHLWFYGFARYKRPKGLENFIHARSNLVSIDPATAYTVQPTHFLHNTDGPHNSKIIFGYMESKAHFQHGDNGDLAHLAPGDRVVVFFPVRHDGNPKDHTDQKIYHVNPNYGAQAPCIIEFKTGEMIAYEWFRDPKKLDGHILFDLRPHLANPEGTLVKPGVTKPILKFDLDPAVKGGWKLQVKLDGREAAKGVADIKWDMTFTHESPGAKKASVNVTPENSSWSLSVFSPGGGPTDSSELVVGLRPYDRATDKDVAWAERNRRLKDIKVTDLPAAMSGKNVPLSK